MWGAAQSHQSMEMLEINSLEVVSHTFHGTSPPPKKKKLVQIKSLSLRSFQGANCVLTCCVLNHCLGLWSPMSQTHPGIIEPKGNCTSARVMGYPGNTTEKPDTSDTTS